MIPCRQGLLEITSECGIERPGSLNHAVIIIIIIIIIIIVPRRRWVDLEEIGINAGNWVDSAQDRNYWIALMIAALNLRVP